MGFPATGDIARGTRFSGMGGRIGCVIDVDEVEGDAEGEGGSGGARGVLICAEVFGTGGGISRDERIVGSRDLLLLLNSFAKPLTEMRGFVLGFVPVPAVFAPGRPAAARAACPSSVVRASAKKLSSENRLEGWGRENVRGGGSRTAGVAGRSDIELWVAVGVVRELATEVREVESTDGRDDAEVASLGARLFRGAASGSSSTGEDRCDCGGALLILDPGRPGGVGGVLRLTRISFATCSNGTAGQLGEALIAGLCWPSLGLL